MNRLTKIEPVDILSWLNQQKNPVKTYWADRDGQFISAGVGAAHTITCARLPPAGGEGKGKSLADYTSLFKKMRDNLSCDHPYRRYYGGISFDGGHYHFVLPEFELFQINGETYFSCNDSDAQEINPAAIAKTPFNNGISRPANRQDSPDKNQWCSMINDALHSFAEGSYEKIVLARKSTFQFDQPPNPYSVVRRLGQCTSNCFVFSFQFKEGEVFLGASPERLFKREGRDVQSEAIAGTRPRGQTQSEDEQFLNELSHSVKDAHEHRLVAGMIQKNLNPLCRSLDADRHPSLLSLNREHHLISRFQGQLQETANDAALLCALHPTPAVAGCPSDKACAAIKGKEPFNRGWYAGPVGYVGKDSTEFAVAIRSGLLKGNTLDLFAGAGIVAGSTPEGEWDEIEHKLGSFLKVFT